MFCAASYAKAQSTLGDEYGNCSRCETCPVNEDYDRFVLTTVILEPGQELSGYVLGDATSFSCQYTCSDLIVCKEPIDTMLDEDLAALADALHMSTADALAYLERYGGKRVIVLDDEEAVQIRGCGNSLIAHLPVAAE